MKGEMTYRDIKKKKRFKNESDLHNGPWCMYIIF